MADSNITKRALAASLKELLEREPLEKISVGAICDGCGMSRKSFYYHFHDKFELIEWIYDTEFIEAVRRAGTASGWGLLARLFEYFYENRSFCRKTLQYHGQNSLEGYLRDVASAVLRRSLAERSLVDVDADSEFVDFVVDFYANAVISTLKRWIVSDNPMPPEKFYRCLFNCIYTLPLASQLKRKRVHEGVQER